MKIYTRKGDEGKTSLYGGKRVSKSIVRFEAIGCVDETNSTLGLALSELNELKTDEKWIEKLIDQLTRIQAELLEVGADLATPFSVRTSLQKSIDRIPASHITRLEKEMDEMDKELPKLKFFILPGGHKISGILQIARSVTRRAERNTVRLNKGAKVNLEVLKYLNRLSDWLFQTARFVNHQTKQQEKIWH